MTDETNKTGAPPGTIVYYGEDQTDKVKITLIEFNETEFIEKEFFDLNECMEHVDPAMVKWINVDGIHDVALIEKIGKHFNIHPLTLEDQLERRDSADLRIVSIDGPFDHHRVLAGQSSQRRNP